MEWLLLLPVLLFSIVLHEVAHAWVARREGDDTAERMGRITLNPIVHLDPVGSVLVPVVLALLPGGFVFGWARPVPVNRANIQTGVWGDIRVSLAGIAANLLLAVGFASALVPVIWLSRPGGFGEVLLSIGYYGVLINLLLAVFNLIPIPPSMARTYCPISSPEKSEVPTGRSGHSGSRSSSPSFSSLRAGSRSS